MEHYLTLTLVPDAEINLYFLWEKVFRQVHLRLVELQDADGKSPIGLSWPEYDLENKKLGTQLRLLAKTVDTLERFDGPQTLRRLSDYVHWTKVRPVPKNIRYGRYKRQQSKFNIARLARRKAKREGISEEQAMALLKNKEAETIEAPFIWATSHSSNHRFRLYIIKEAEIEQPTDVGFSCYGLSAHSTVPEF